MDFYTVNLRGEYLKDEKWITSLSVRSLIVIADSPEVAIAKINQCIENQTTETLRFVLDGEIHKGFGLLQVDTLFGEGSNIVVV